MQITETLNEGLKREIKVVVPKEDLAQQLSERLAEAKDKIRLNGFRPGKVPIAHLKKTYGKSFMAEVVNEILNEKPKNIIADRGEKAAMAPEVNMTEDETAAGRVLDGQEDFEFTLSYEIVPAIELKDAKVISVTRPTIEIAESEVEEQLKTVAKSALTYDEKKGAAADGDRVTIDYLGKVDGEAFEGGADQDAQLVLGSNQFIPGFEDQLIGVKAGDEKVINVKFPDEYGAAQLAGKDATFDIKVKEVAAAADQKIDDELAKQLGLDDLEHLKRVVREQIEGQYASMTRQKVKRELLDALDAEYKFEAPSKLVDAEFENIWRQVTGELEQAGRTFADEDTTEEDAREEYRTLAERRVRLGLVLSEIGEKEAITVTEEEMQRALFDQVRRFQGQEKEIYDFYRSNPEALASLRAPVFEEKVVDHLLSVVNVTDKVVTKEELMAEDEDEAKEEKPAKKKAAPKKKKSDEA